MSIWEYILVGVGLFIAYHLIKRLIKHLFNLIVALFLFWVSVLPIAATIVLSILNIWFLPVCILLGIGYYYLLFRIKEWYQYKKSGAV
jgi:hypothetical protein